MQLHGGSSSKKRLQPSCGWCGQRFHQNWLDRHERVCASRPQARSRAPVHQASQSRALDGSTAEEEGDATGDACQDDAWQGDAWQGSLSPGGATQDQYISLQHSRSLLLARAGRRQPLRQPLPSAAEQEAASARILPRVLAAPMRDPRHRFGVRNWSMINTIVKHHLSREATAEMLDAQRSQTAHEPLPLTLRSKPQANSLLDGYLTNGLGTDLRFHPVELSFWNGAHPATRPFYGGVCVPPRTPMPTDSKPSYVSAHRKEAGAARRAIPPAQGDGILSIPQVSDRG